MQNYHNLELDGLSRSLDALPSLPNNGIRGLEVTIVLTEPDTARVDKSIVRWAQAAVSRRNTVTPVKYTVDIDWSRYDLRTFWAVFHEIGRFYLATEEDTQVHAEFYLVVAGMWRAWDRYQEEGRLQ